MLIDFWVPRCGPCRAVAPVLHQVAQEYEGRLTVAKVNIDEEPQIAAAFGVRSIPTLLVLHDRKVLAATMGALRKACSTASTASIPPAAAPPVGADSGSPSAVHSSKPRAAPSTPKARAAAPAPPS